MSFKVSHFTGDYKYRQLAANAAGVDLYIEYHFNFYSKSTSYTLVKVPVNPKALSVNFGRTHSELVSENTNIPLYTVSEEPGSSDKGILFCKKNSRDAYNFSLLTMPSVIIEPLFLSNAAHVDLIGTDEGIELLANILVETLHKVMPTGGHVGMSVGHKYQKTTPMDRGSMAVNRPELTEADLADRIVQHASFMLRNNMPATLYRIEVPRAPTNGQLHQSQGAD